VSISLKTEAWAAKFAPEQQRGGEGNYQQRDQLLPIHAGKITPKSRCATKDLRRDHNPFLTGAKQELRTFSPLPLVFFLFSSVEGLHKEALWRTVQIG
jgi:hypothetical protein